MSAVHDKWWIQGGGSIGSAGYAASAKSWYAALRSVALPSASSNRQIDAISLLDNMVFWREENSGTTKMAEYLDMMYDSWAKQH